MTLDQNPIFPKTQSELFLMIRKGIKMLSFLQMSNLTEIDLKLLITLGIYILKELKLTEIQTKNQNLKESELKPFKRI